MVIPCRSFEAAGLLAEGGGIDVPPPRGDLTKTSKTRTPHKLTSTHTHTHAAPCE